MFGWLRDALGSAPSSFANHHSNTPSSLFRQPNQKQQQQQQQQQQHSSDDDEINQSNDNSFYHNPYHSSGQMNYADVPQQQYTNEHTYPTYLARQQTFDTTNQTLDDQIQTKLMSLQQRPNQCQYYAHRQNNYGHRNRTTQTPVLPATPRSSFISNRNEQRRSSNDERSDEDEEEDDDDDDVDDEEEEKSSSIETYHGIPGYYSGQYPHIDEQFDLASVVLWYRNVMQSVKKYLPNNQNYIHGETNEYNSHHYSLSSQSPILSKQTNENNILLNYENEHSNNPLSSSKVKWMGAVRTVKQLNQVRK